MTNKEIREHLLGLQDLGYKEFHCKLIPNVDSSRVIGVRTPMLRRYAKELIKSGNYQEFISELPHEYFDEMNLHGMIICNISDYEEAVCEIDKFLPYVDNWATCDLLSFKKAFKGNLGRLEHDVCRWINSGDTYTMRFGMGVLLEFYLDEAFNPRHLEWVATVESDEYYVRMMQAWYFATAIAKQYEASIPYIEQHRLHEWTHRKAIQKARESFRVSDEVKAYLKSLK
ncbi:DNA alkylation repair protein [Mogibacterium timidum]|uniref:DNA alkylation repair protein n=1 Tax=Mogibacterium timidum TaxID=35519 RepID=UPI0028D5F2EA|nr:DNA alkylation repair protein [Mogibacterium timidum]